MSARPRLCGPGRERPACARRAQRRSEW